MWSTLYMKPGNQIIISEWLARSRNTPLTVIAEFEDTYDHLPCRYQDSAAATLTDPNDHRICPRHEAVLSLDQLLPHRSQIRDLDVLLHSSDPGWNDDNHRDDGVPVLLSHPFFRETLPNLQRLDFRATHVEQDRYMIPIPDSLFAGELPCLQELKYLGVSGGLMERVKNLASCEIGYWSGSAGPSIIFQGEFQEFFNNNKTIKSLTLDDCRYIPCSDQVVTPTPMRDLKFLKLQCSSPGSLKPILEHIPLPQFKSLHTVELSPRFYALQVVATDGSSHTFEFLQSIRENSDFYPLQYLGAEISTLRLDRRMSLREFDWWPGLYEFFLSLDSIQVLEFDGAVASVGNVVSNILLRAGVFPGLKVIRVAIGRDDCEGALQLLATALRLRMEERNPLTTIEPLLAEFEDGVAREIRAEWEKHYEAKGIQNFLSG